MVRAASRTILALLLAAVVSLVLSPLIWAAARPTLASTATTFGFPTIPPFTTVGTTPATIAKPATTVRPGTVKPRVTVPFTGTTTSTTPPTLPPTTVAPIPSADKPPVTLPLSIGHQSGHVSAVFPVLGGIGIFSLIALLATQWFLTDPHRRGPTL